MGLFAVTICYHSKKKLKVLKRSKDSKRWKNSRLVLTDTRHPMRLDLKG